MQSAQDGNRAPCCFSLSLLATAGTSGHRWRWAAASGLRILLTQSALACWLISLQGNTRGRLCLTDEATWPCFLLIVPALGEGGLVSLKEPPPFLLPRWGPEALEEELPGMGHPFSCSLCSWPRSTPGVASHLPTWRPIELHGASPETTPPGPKLRRMCT